MQNEYVILKSPVKIGDYERVASYAGSLTKGEEQILVTRDLKFFLTDGKGGYLEFKSINSGITVDEVTQKLNDLNSSLFQNIEDLNTKTNSKIISLKDAVNALNLKFDSYVTTTEFNNLKAQVESNATLATHTNRDTLDKFSEDTSGNPLFNGKKIVADFDTSGIEAEIADLSNRSVIGSKLKNGLFKVTNTIPAASIAANTQIVMGTKISGDFNLNTDNTVTLPRGSVYRVRTALRYSTTSSDGYMVYCIRDFTNSKNVGVSGTINSYEDWDGQQEALAYIDTTKQDIKIGVYNLATVNPNEITAAFSFLEIQEVNRTIILDPAEEAKNINFECGMFKMSDSPSIMTAGDVIKFNTMIIGNMSINPSTYQIPLKANKKYTININISGVYHNTVFALYNMTTGALIQILYGAVQDTDFNYLSISNIIYSPTTDCNIGVKCYAVYGAYTSIALPNTQIVIQEIAQPYYFNYYKDSIEAITIFDGTAGDITSTFTLTDSVNNYEKLIIYACCLIDSVKREKASITVNVKDIVFGSSDYEFLAGAFASSSHNYFIEVGFKSKTTFKIGNLSSVGWTNPIIYKIEGIGYSYDNPYQDVITTVDESTITDIQVDSDITSIWGEVEL